MTRLQMPDSEIPMTRIDYADMYITCLKCDADFLNKTVDYFTKEQDDDLRLARSIIDAMLMRVKQ